MALTRERVGSQEKLAEVSGVDRTTIFRWTKGDNLPQDPSGLFRVAKALGVDPLVLWTLDRSVYDKATGLISLITRNRSWASAFGGVEYLDGLLFPCTDWPNEELARKMDRHWQFVEFRHNPALRMNYYQKIILPSTNWQVWYFAYRHVSGVNRTWQPYGFVVRRPTILRLFSMSSFSEIELHPQSNSIAVETWFGPGSAEFKICTLDKIQLTLAEESNDSLGVRFEL